MSEFLNNMPKVELHVHLEGAIPLPALWELVHKYDIPHEVPDLAALERRFQYVDFPHFIDTWIWMTRFFREADDFTFMADAVASDLARQNILYAEITYAPGGMEEYGMGVQKVTEAIRKGLDRHRDRITVNLIADLIRDMGPTLGEKWLWELKEVRDSCGVVGIGIGGSEQKYPPEPYARVYELARSFGFHTSAHAGEAAGPQSVWGALRALKVDRIGHATRAIEDPALVEELRIRRIPLEMCPISNMRTGGVPDYTKHPIQHFYKQGLIVTVNTDDPTMFGNNLVMEFEGLSEVFGFSEKDIRDLTLNAVESAWCDEEARKRLAREIDSAFSVG